ncbi:hypothetical protein GTN66_01905 [bacterium]|nr:hypothetical protein [bacterium]NIN91970.1 hypothetical protein [bacterium]NIO18186.1 hypothetical protein [bacterium]NIO73160.1 hypothetical protein [bacterium]
MKGYNVVRKKIEDIVVLVNSLKQEKAKLLEEIERQKEDIKSMEGENKTAKKIVAEAERLEKEKKAVKERLRVLLDRLEKMKV